MSPRSRISLLVLTVAAILVANVLGGAPLRQAVLHARSIYQPGQSESVLSARNESAFGQILGEVRATMSDLMFIKADRYLHAGAGYAPRARIDTLNEQKQMGGGDQGSPTTIHSAAEDFRGFLGDLEREVKPYREASQAHVHTELTELLPWFRLMTLSNPRFVRGYRVGGMTLVEDGQWQEAQQFMDEGLANNQDNPEVFRLYQTVASLHRLGRNNRRYPWDGQWLDKALAAALQGFDLAKRQRPPHGEVGAQAPSGLVWTDDIEEDFDLAVHMIPQLCREQAYRDHDRSKLELALRYAQELAELAPTYSPIGRFVVTLQAELAAWKPGEPAPTSAPPAAAGASTPPATATPRAASGPASAQTPPAAKERKP
jgi:tetratricopeptide (TPR) repeat protein